MKVYQNQLTQLYLIFLHLHNNHLFIYQTRFQINFLFSINFKYLSLRLRSITCRSLDKHYLMLQSVSFVRMFINKTEHEYGARVAGMRGEVRSTIFYFTFLCDREQFVQVYFSCFYYLSCCVSIVFVCTWCVVSVQQMCMYKLRRCLGMHLVLTSR